MKKHATITSVNSSYFNPGDHIKLFPGGATLEVVSTASDSITVTRLNWFKRIWYWIIFIPFRVSPGLLNRKIKRFGEQILKAFRKEL